MSRPDALALLPLAESIADGAVVDWDAVEETADEGDRAVIRQLRLLSQLAGLHRSLPADPSDLPAATMPPRTATAPAIGNWAHLALIERLGGGTFGDVYRAWDRHLECEVALKLRRADESVDDLRESRIAREGRLLARVRHANVVTVHGVNAHDGRVGLWMELVRGVTLEQQLAAHGPFSAREAAAVGIDLCRALAAIHGAGLIHRDVKAQNVMRQDGGRIVLMDLGTGREVDPHERRALPDLAGTPLYLAPEIFGGATASAGTDLYSLGVLLYHLVTGSFPVAATTIEELQNGHVAGRAVRLRDARADLPTAFVRVVDRAIAAEPSRRYESAGALEADLAQALDASVSSPASVPRSTDSSRRKGVWATVVLGGLAAAVAALVAVPWPWSPTARPPGPVRSIAVLPLANLSGDPSQDYFADGMTDELIGALGELGSVNVISRTSAMQFKGSTQPLPEIARALHVDAVLEGTVLVQPGGRAGSPSEATRVRITARLIYAGSDTQLWDRTFERAGADVLALRGEVSRAVAEGIGLRLTSQPQSFHPPTVAAGNGGARQFDVFDLYLKGRYAWNLRTEEGMRQSIPYFQEAIDRDPGYAPAFAGLADAYAMLGSYGFFPRASAEARAFTAASKAIELDGSLAEAHASLAAIHDARYEWAEAEDGFRRAIALKPGYATAHHWYASHLTLSGRFTEALSEVEQARVLDPLSVGIQGQYGATLMMARRYDEAVDQLQRVIRMSPAIARPRTMLVDAYAYKTDYDRALIEAGRAAQLGGNPIELVAALGYANAMAGRRAAARRIADELTARYQSGEDETAGAVASIDAALGDENGAFQWLDRARLRREAWVAYLKVDPKFDTLRADPRFTTLLASVGLSR